MFINLCIIAILWLILKIYFTNNCYNIDNYYDSQNCCYNLLIFVWNIYITQPENKLMIYPKEQIILKVSHINYHLERNKIYEVCLINEGKNNIV